MKDYSGAFDPEFRLEDLSHDTLAWYGREVMLANHIHDRGIMPLVFMQYGDKAQTRVACDEWMGSSPIYNARNRELLGIGGNDVGTIFKAFQFDIGAPHTFLQFHWQLNDPGEGFFWLTHCGAYNHVRRMTNADPEAETQICHHMEDPTFDATVMTVNQGARCRPVFRPPHGEVPAEGPCRWKVFIGDDLVLPERNPMTDIIAASRAAQFEFAPIELEGDGLADYSGAFRRDFRLEDLDHAVLARQCKEFALDVHLLQRACYGSIARHHGEEALMAMAPQQWAAIAPVYVHRLRRVFNIQGDDMSAILKLLQVDPFLPPEYLKTGCALLDENTGRFWVEDCAALNDDRPSGLLSLLDHPEGPGIKAPVNAVNPKARLSPLSPGDCPEAQGRAVLAWEIYIDESHEPVARSDMADLVAGADLWEHDASRHRYFYSDAA